MPIPAACENGLTYLQQPPFNLGNFNQDSGAFVINGNRLEFDGSPIGAAAYLNKTGLDPRDLRVLAVFDYRHQNSNTQDGTRYAGGIGLSKAAVTVPESFAGFNMTFPGGFGSQLVSAGIAGTGSIDLYNSGPIFPRGTIHLNCEIHLTCSALKLNNKIDLTIRVVVPGYVDHSETIIDWLDYTLVQLVNLHLMGQDHGTSGSPVQSYSLLELVGTGFPESCNPAPGAPTLLTPVDGASGLDSTPTFTWGAASGATAYNLVIANDQALTDIVYNADDITALSHTITTPLTEGRLYYWSVRGKN